MVIRLLGLLGLLKVLRGLKDLACFENAKAGQGLSLGLLGVLRLYGY